MTDKKGSSQQSVANVVDIAKTEANTAQVPEVTENDDVAAAFLAEIATRPDAEELLAEPTKKEEKALLRKADAIVVTLLQVALMMGSVDKVSIGSAAVLGMRSDAKLVGQEYAWTSAIIYFGGELCPYRNVLCGTDQRSAIAAIIPSLMLMQRLPANRYIAINVMLWGMITSCMAASRNYADLMGIRFLLGCFESVIFAGFGLLISMWYKREEQPFRTAIVFSTLSSVMNGLLATACVSYTGKAIAQWRLLFLLTGLITFAWSGLLLAFLPANPTSAKWLSLRQRVIATRRMGVGHTGMENKVFKPGQAIEAIVDPKTWLVCCINIVLNIPNGGLITFNSIIVNSLGFTPRETTLLGIPTGKCVFSWISSLLFGYIAVKTKQRCFSAMASCVIPFLGTILLYVVPRTNIGGSLASLYLVYFYWGPYIVMMGAVYANTGGYTKKMIVYALAYVGYCVGNIIGPQTFQANQAPKYTGGVIAMLTCYGVAIVLIFVYRLVLVYLNKRRAAQYEAFLASGGQVDGLLDDWQDQTDFQNPRFHYEL